MRTQTTCIAVALIALGIVTSVQSAGQVTGELRTWHKVTITFDGPKTSEMDERNPFTDYRLNVTFSKGDKTCVVPGYYAADGNAANSGADSGNKWRVHFTPSEPGEWKYEASLQRGTLVAVSDEPQAGSNYLRESGSFVVEPTDKTGRDFRGKGRLQYVGKHYLQFAGTGEYFLKAGPDAPETLLAYADFDDTVARKQSNVPAQDLAAARAGLEAGRPDLEGRQGQGPDRRAELPGGQGLQRLLLPALQRRRRRRQRLAVRRARRQAALRLLEARPMGHRVRPRHRLGLYLHFKLQENEIDDNRRGDKREQGLVPESLDGGKLGAERKLYCRELIARFGHDLALNWNIGEENTQTHRGGRGHGAVPPRHRSLPASHRHPHLPEPAGQGVYAAAGRQVAAHRRCRCRTAGTRRTSARSSG